MARVRIGVVGCGVIAHRYAAQIAREERLELVAAMDASAGRAEAFVAEHGGRAHGSLDALLADDGVELVLNLTVPHAHARVTASALAAVKHVHTEKPLALSHGEARHLVELAAAQGVRLSTAPATLLGEAQQTAWKLIRDGAIGRVRVVYAEANWDRIELWHPEPEGLYAVGPLVDVGVYPLTIVTAVLGPVRSVVAAGAVVERERTTRAGAPFAVSVPDVAVAVLELSGGEVVRVTASFYVGPSKQRGIEWHGDAGSVYTPTWAEADSRVELLRRGGEYERIPHVRTPCEGIDWARPLVDLAEALEEGRPHRAAGDHAAHVVEVLEAARISTAEGRAVEVTSSFSPPEPMAWAR